MIILRDNYSNVAQILIRDIKQYLRELYMSSRTFE